ncbi:MAG: four helix bundle protein [bacterium]|nr:four helix bundle protein [bacterium]
MSNAEMTKHPYDLEERTAIFGEEIIKFCKQIPRNPITDPLIIQLTKSGTSVGANYCEADDAESKKDFCHKIGICKKEARESKHWLRMIVTAVPILAPQARVLWQEAKELNLIFNKIVKTSRLNS